VPVATRMYLETLALFGGTGALILFFGALAVGRFSMLAAKDAVLAEADSEYYPGYPSSQPAGAAQSAPYDTTPDQFPTSTGQFPSVTGRYSQPTQFPGSSAQLSDAPTQASDTPEYPPTASV
jgi:hypothetical protein